MAQTVATYQQSAFSTPIAGGALAAAVVLGNDNNLRTAYNSHDADPGIHFQGSTLGARPAASTAGRKWLTTDGLRLYYDTGSVWSEAAYLPLVGGTMANTTVVTDLNADLLDGQEGAYYTDVGNADAGTLPIARGGLGITTVPSNGFIPIGDGTDYIAAAITGGAGITVTPGAGSITIAVTGGTPNTGAGTANKIVKYTATNVQAISSITDTGTAVSTGSSVSARVFRPAFSVPSYVASIVVDLSVGSLFLVTGDAGVTSPVTIAAPSVGTPATGDIIRFIFHNTSGGSNLSVIWNAAYVGEVLATVGLGDYAAESFVYNGSNWVSLATVDGGLP
ncbi:MAG TPA: hypothetical protein VMX15_00070 [Candidatus Heimdallarchaeota archaeon]|nr:hypothetical protein [Candidatus Heimdallarchaeota archaeon]